MGSQYPMVHSCYAGQVMSRNVCTAWVFRSSCPSDLPTQPNTQKHRSQWPTLGSLSQLHSKYSDSTPVGILRMHRRESRALSQNPPGQGDKCVLRLSSFAESVLGMSREEPTGVYWSQWELPGKRFKGFQEQQSVEART